MLLTLLILLASFSRVIPHILNFSPLGAIGIFGAAHFNKKWHAIIIPIAATWISDLFINNVIYARYYPTFTWFYQGFYWQYAAYILITLFGIFIYKNKINLTNITFGAIGSGIIFFLVSNAGCWVGNSFYAQNFSGLLSCYAAGIPFYKGTLLGDIFYTTILFGGYYILQKRFSILKLAYTKYA